MDFDARLTTFSLQHLPYGCRVKRILGAALQAVDPGAAVIRNAVRKGETLYIEDHLYPLDRYQRCLVLAIGKAAVPMGEAAVKILGPFFSEGILLTKAGYSENLAGIEYLPGLPVLEAGHPIPDQRSVMAAHRIAELLKAAGEDDLVICLISGGGSALLSAPVEGVSLPDLQAITGRLLACGASITEINTLRKHLETLKGGGLARLAFPATIIALVLSDVINDPLDVIASGPCTPDPSTFEDCLQILDRYGISNQVPSSILRHLQRGAREAVSETPKPGDKVFDRVSHTVVGNNRSAATAALTQARKEGFNSILLTTSLQGEARSAGQIVGAIAREIDASQNPVPRPACIIAGGETTVTIRGDGLGGRNQELALGAIAELAGLEGVALVTLATDGGDGPTDAAGAVVTGESFARAQSLGLSPPDYLARNDAYHFFDALGDLLKPGPTQTNVNDLEFLFAG